MKFRTARPADAPAVAAVYEEAKGSMRALGIDQWQRGIPGRATAEEDIAAGVTRVAEEDGRILAAFNIVPGGEEDYRHIENGAWLTEGEGYGAVHRVVIAIGARGSGLSTSLVRTAAAEAAARGFESIRIDTHPGNLPMRRMLEKHGFICCGRIHLIGGPDDGAERVAYELPLVFRTVDITRELFTAPVYPGDDAPAVRRIASVTEGDGANVSALSLCAHNGTHTDAPLHFLSDGADVEAMGLTPFLGAADVLDAPAGEIPPEALSRLPGDCRRLLIRGGGYLSPDAARAAADRGICLIGVEGVSVGETAAPAAVHRILAHAGIAVLENLDLSPAAPGRYHLAALPLRGAGLEGAPVRAVLTAAPWIDPRAAAAVCPARARDKEAKS